MKKLLVIILTLVVYQSIEATELAANKVEKTCYGYDTSHSQWEKPSFSFCFNNNEVYFYDKYSLYSRHPTNTPLRTEKIVKLFRTLPTEGIEPVMTLDNQDSIFSLFILTEKGTIIYMDRYNDAEKGEFSIGNVRYQYLRNYDLDYK